ncbi:MAG: hypothetical protein OXU67_07820 [Chloroflexota bacterium]|nr:hypothetical protein [Chloroflexota bacterium]
MNYRILTALMGQSRTTPGIIRAALPHPLARWQPVLLLGLALLVGGLLRFPGLHDRLEPIHRESELVILAYTRAPDDLLCTVFAASGLCSASMSPTTPQAVESYGPGQPRAGPAVVWRRLVGVGPGDIERGRLVSAIAGLATIVACWWVARVLAGPLAGSVAAHAYAIAPLAVIPNRLALPVSTATLCLVLDAGCAALAYRRQRSRSLALAGLVLLALAGLLDGAVAAAMPLLLLAAVAWRSRAGTLGRLLGSYVRSRRGLLALLAGVAVVAALVGVGYSRIFQVLLVVRNLAWTLVFDLPVGGWVALLIGAYFVARHGTPAARVCAAGAAVLIATAGLMDLLGGRGAAPDVLPALALWIVAAATLAPRLVDGWRRLRANDGAGASLAVAAALVTVSLVVIPALLLSTRWSLDPANAEVSPNEQWEYQAGQESGGGCTALVDTLRTLSADQPLTVVGLGSRHSCLRMRIVTESLPVTWQDDLPRAAAPPLPAPPTGVLLAQAEYLGSQRVRTLSSRALAPSGWELILRTRRPQGVYGYALYRPSISQR